MLRKVKTVRVEKKIILGPVKFICTNRSELRHEIQAHSNNYLCVWISNIVASQPAGHLDAALVTSDYRQIILSKHFVGTF